MSIFLHPGRAVFAEHVLMCPLLLYPFFPMTVNGIKVTENDELIFLGHEDLQVFLDCPYALIMVVWHLSICEPVIQSLGEICMYVVLRPLEKGVFCQLS